MIRSDRLIIAATTVAVVGVLLFGIVIGEYPASANVFPALAAAGVLVSGLFALREPIPEHPDGEFSWTALLWLLGVLPLIVLLGFRVGLPIYAFAYAFARGTRLPASLGVAAGVFAVVEVLFVRVLALPLSWGWLIEAAR